MHQKRLKSLESNFHRILKTMLCR